MMRIYACIPADPVKSKKKAITGCRERVDLRQPRYTLLRAIVPFALANKGKQRGELLDRE